jgi:hypothetical protein
LKEEAEQALDSISSQLEHYNLNIAAIIQAKESLYLWLFAVLFVSLGLSYATFTPIFENSDETLHYPYVKHLADGRGLPLALPNQLWNQEGTQPPLYYAIVAASTFWIDSDNLADHLQYNPHWLFTEVRALSNDNQNRVLHGPMDAFPYHRAALAVHIGRWWSLFFGLVTVVCTFLIGRQLFPSSLSLALTATALTALTPQFLRVSATVSNDSLSAALASLTVWLALKFTEPFRWPASATAKSWSADLSLHSRVYSVLPPLLLGLLAGLALLTKLSSLSTAFLAGYIIFWRLFFLSELHERPLQTMLRWLLFIAAVMAAMTGWWFLRNYQLYGEWLAIETHLNLAGRGHLSLADVWELRAEVERAYWATFGWGQIRPPEWVFRLLSWFFGLGLGGLVLALLARLIQGDKSRLLPLNLSQIHFAPILFLLFWAGLNLILYLRWVMEVGSVSHTRLLFPAITAISLLLAVGWHALLPRSFAAWFSSLTGVGLLLLNLYSLGWLITPAFQPNEQINLMSDRATPLNLTFVDSMQLVAGEVYSGQGPADPAPPWPTAAPGDIITIGARWQVVTPPPKNYSVAAVLLAPDGAVLARRETYPGLGLRPTRYLNPGDTFVDLYPLHLTAEVTEPMVARAVISLFDFDSETHQGLPAVDAASNEVTPIVGQIKITPKNWPHYQPQQAVSVNFANVIALTGYGLDSELTLYWRSLAPVAEDYMLFIHFLDADGNLVTQADAPPTQNTYPTRWWATGEIIADSHQLPEAPAATRLRLGLYSLISGQRLPIIESSLPVQDNGIELALPPTTND